MINDTSFGEGEVYSINEISGGSSLCICDPGCSCSTNDRCTTYGEMWKILSGLTTGVNLL